MYVGQIAILVHINVNKCICCIYFKCMFYLLLVQVSDNWISSGSGCPDTSVACLPSKHFLGETVYPMEDRYFIDVHGVVKLYLVLDGHDGPKASDFVGKHLPERILSSKILGKL